MRKRLSKELCEFGTEFTEKLKANPSRDRVTRQTEAPAYSLSLHYLIQAACDEVSSCPLEDLNRETIVKKCRA